MTEANNGCGDAFRADRRATVEQLTTKMNQGLPKCLPNYYSVNIAASGPPEADAWFVHLCSTAVHRRRGLEFARQYSSWTSTEWRQVAFSDESRFMLHRTDGRWRIRRETSERNHPATIAGTVQAGGGSINGLGNVFLAFSGFTDHCERRDGSIQVTHLSLRTMSTPTCALFSSG
ncbi:transposable element Tcb1 transposase [Trichonephila clavipes]|nr:transposable element Tcb1 transposase [Trichonephila clavipes]